MKKNIFYTIVPLNYHDYRIDKFLQSQINELSRTRLQALISEGQVKLNNITINNSSKKIKEKDKIKINFPPSKETSTGPINPFLSSLHPKENSFANPSKEAPCIYKPRSLSAKDQLSTRTS